MPALPVLYSFRRCPYAIRARMALYSSGKSCELREVVLKNKPDSMLAASSKGTVPVLIKTDGQVLDESLDIMHWALQQADPQQLLNTVGNSLSTQEQQQLIEDNDQSFKPKLDRYKYFDRHPEQTQAQYLQQALSFLTNLNALLNDSDYLNGSRLSLVDIAIFPFVRQFAFVDKPTFDQLPLPSLQRWLQQQLDSALFNAVMHKYSAWEDNQTETVIFGQTIKAYT